ncbi:MAG: alpha/beta fold hydrolase [Deltaproteobacteria bacterium]|nr:alpha/beta fold hydrolase [Deltaproteobacteria bacterium]
MKKTKLFAAAVILVLIPGFAFAGGASTACQTRYPVVMAHGMAASAKILGIVDYWWGIPEALRDEGAKVYVTSVNAMDSTLDKAADFKQQLLHILAVTGASKANIIGHSHGGIYTRLAMTNMGIGSKVASLTTISTPHRGSSIADLVVEGLPDWLLSAGTDIVDFVYAFIFGDTNPDSMQNALDLTTDYMVNVFNPNTPNVPGVYYQSWCAAARYSCPSVVLEPTWIVLLAMEGTNDGMVSVPSAKWGTYRGTQQGAWYSPGVDHCNIVGHLFGITPGFDAPDFYVDVVKDLKNRGY